MASYQDITVNINDIDVDNRIIPPDDPEFMPLYMKAIKREITITKALIKPEGVKPFSPHFRPILTEENRDQYKYLIEEKRPHLLHVYKKNNIFIMSDDYFAYTYYTEITLPLLPCIILGDSESEWVVEKSEESFVCES